MLQLKLKGSLKHIIKKSNDFDFKPRKFKTLNELISVVLKIKDINKMVISIIDPHYPVTDRDREFENFIKSDHLNSFLKDFGLSISKLRGGGVNVTPFDLFRLIDSYQHQYINDSVLFYYISDEGVVYHCNVNRKTNIKSYIYEQFSDDDVYLPLLKKSLTEEIIAGELTSHLLMNSCWSLVKEGGILFPFPKFNRPLKLEFKQYLDLNIHPCINCRRCMDYCPEAIFPAFYYHYINKEMEEEVAALGVKDCTLCGLCNFVCPSNLKLTDTIEQFLIAEESEA